MDANFQSTSLDCLSYAIVQGEVKEGSDRAPKSGLKFQVTGFQEEVSQNVNGKREKHTQQVTIDKRAFTNIHEFVDSNEMTLEDIKYGPLVRHTEKVIPGLSAHLNDVMKGTEEPLRLFLATAMEVIKENEKTQVSNADPERDAKSEVCKHTKYTDLLSNPEQAVKNAYQALSEEIAMLTARREKLSSISLDTFLSYAEEKFANNGVDEDGFVMLRAKKSTKVSE